MKIAIIGGGAAGMMAAATINELAPDVEVVLIEKNAVLGRKVTISGGGRCNVTTGFHNVKEVLARYPRGDKFLRHAMFNFSPEKVYEWFERLGVKLKVEKDFRVFPASNNGGQIVESFAGFFRGHKTEVRLRTTVKAVEREAEGFELEYEDSRKERFDKIIITTGGQAYRFTGSTGDGYTFAEKLCHKVTSLAASLNSFVTEETWPEKISGVSFVKVGLKAKSKDPTLQRPKDYEFAGPIIFTHKGISGPAVFAMSSLIAMEHYDRKDPITIYIDFVTEKSWEQVRDELQKMCNENPKKKFGGFMAKFVPKSVAELLCKISDRDSDTSLRRSVGLINSTSLCSRLACEVSKKEINKIVENLKNLPLNAVERGSGDEFVTAGGVDTSEVDDKTMQSKLVPGVYFAGEILNIDGFTGGYNLQAAWASGRLAGESAVA